MNLSDPTDLRGVLARHGISAAKGLGQHFLCSRSVVEAISFRFEGFRGLLEIGPGPGVLTSRLSQNAQTIALEIDGRMLPVLSETAPDAEVRKVDALEADLSTILAELPTPRGVVSNLPYYITGPLLDRIAGAAQEWSKAVLMMQREVGDRVIAPAGDSRRGSLSVCLQAQFAISKVCDVPPDAFLPPPKVSSTVLELVPSRAVIPAGLPAVVRSGFKQPRKTLSNNLLAAGWSRERVGTAFRAAGLDDRVRPHMLTLQQWEKLFLAA